MGVLTLDSLILVGDLNCTIWMNDIWGGSGKVDSIVEQIKDIIANFNLVDICPPCISPTWDNGRMGDGHVAKRLDRFLLREHLIEILGTIQSGIINNFISYHRPIILQWK